MLTKLSNLKRANSTSPSAMIPKSSKITKISCNPEETEIISSDKQDIEEDLILVKIECAEVKTKNFELRKQLKEYNQIKMDNVTISKKLKEQEFETVKI